MDSKGFKLTVTVDAKAVSDELDKVTNGLKKEFNDLQEEYADLKAEYDQRVKELAGISGYIEDLAEYGYTDKEGHPLHNSMPFVRIADIVGAVIPKTDFIHAKVKNLDTIEWAGGPGMSADISQAKIHNPLMRDDLNNAKIAELSADKITANAYKEFAGEQEVKEYEVNAIADAGIKEAAIHSPIMDSDLKEKMVWVKELGVYILPKEK